MSALANIPSFKDAPAKIKWPVLILASAGLVASICHFDSSRQRTNETALALRWSRQISTQAESLALAASEKGEIDPLGWAARILSQGTDSRIIVAEKYHATDYTNESHGENFGFDAATGVFDYAKILFPEDSTGIEIKLYVARTGLFGAKTLFTQDLSIALLFTLFLTLLALTFRKREKEVIFQTVFAENEPPPFQETPPPPPLEPEMVAAEPAINKDWVAGFSAALIELGKDIRNVTQSAQKISGSALEARNQVAAIQALVDGAIKAPLDPEEMTNLAKSAQALFIKADGETKDLMRRLLKVSLQKAAETEAFKKKLVDVAASSHAAFNALKNVKGHARDMSAGISKTTSDVRNLKKEAVPFG